MNVFAARPLDIPKAALLRKSTAFEAFFALVVVSNSVFIGVEVHRNIVTKGGPTPQWLQALWG